MIAGSVILDGLCLIEIFKHLCPPSFHDVAFDFVFLIGYLATSVFSFLTCFMWNSGFPKGNSCSKKFRFASQCLYAS